MKIDLIASNSRGSVLIDGQPLSGVIDITVCMASGRPPRVMLTLQPEALNVSADGAQVFAREPAQPDSQPEQPEGKPERAAKGGGKGGKPEAAG